MLNGLKTSTIGKLRMAEAQEKKDGEEFATNMAKMEEDMDKNADEVERLTGVVNVNSACVDETAKYIFELGGQNGRIAKQEHILGKATAMCKTFKDEHDKTTGLRKQQRGLLDALREALKVKLDQIYGSARVRAD